LDDRLAGQLADDDGSTSRALPSARAGSLRPPGALPRGLTASASTLSLRLHHKGQRQSKDCS
jgi:hypothetical protein